MRLDALPRWRDREERVLPDLAAAGGGVAAESPDCDIAVDRCPGAGGTGAPLAAVAAGECTPTERGVAAVAAPSASDARAPPGAAATAATASEAAARRARRVGGTLRARSNGCCVGAAAPELLAAEAAGPTGADGADDCERAIADTRTAGAALADRAGRVRGSITEARQSGQVV